MAELLKDYYNPALVHQIASAVAGNFSEFRSEEFVNDILDNSWEGLELKERIRKLSTTLRKYLPDDYETAVQILCDSCGEIKGGLEGMFLPDFVEQYGIADWDASMTALAVFTAHSTSEFAIRPFIILDQKKAFDQLKIWSKSKNEHHRRLSSEGCRPKLPWASPLRSLIQDPTPIILILETLKNDPSEYVRRSVANNLNDISKDHPELVLKLAKKWIGKTAETDKLLRHGLRTLLKKPHPKALELFDYGSASKVICENWSISKQSISIGEKVQFTFSLDVSNFKGKIRVEYLIDFIKANGSTSTKVFQWVDKTLGAENVLSSTKSHDFKNLTTRVHYPGIHLVHLRVNGTVIATSQISLK